MVNRENAKKHISETCGFGWLNFVDIIYDHLPAGVTIKSVHQKYGGLKVDFEGLNDDFDFITQKIYLITQFICEKCGRGGRKAIVDGWEITICDSDFESIKAIQKIRTESLST